MRYLDRRVEVICRELRNLSVVSTETIEHLQYKKGNFIYPEDAEKAEQPWEAFDSLTMHWYGTDEHYWFKAEYTVPERLQGKEIWLGVKTQIDEWDDARNPQFLLFLDGEPVQGMDMMQAAAAAAKAVTMQRHPSARKMTKLMRTAL